MCKAPKPPAPQEPKKPQFLRNRYLEGAFGQSSMVNSLRQGRAQLRIPLGQPAGIAGREPVGQPQPEMGIAPRPAVTGRQSNPRAIATRRAVMDNMAGLIN